MITLGRLARGASTIVDVTGRLSSRVPGRDSAKVSLRSSTAQTVGDEQDESEE